MIVYSVTITLEGNIHDEWLDWMESEHIPDVMKTGYFESYTIQRLLDPPPDPGTLTYNIQYLAPSIYEFQQYESKAAPALREASNQRFKDKFAAFRTILKRL